MPQLSPRAQEILASVERDAAARRVSLAAVPDPGPAPRDDATRPGDPSRLLALVETVARGADEVQQRIDRLHREVDAIAGRLGLDLGDQPAERSAVAVAVAPQADAEPAAPALLSPPPPAPPLPAALQGVVSSARAGGLIAPAGGAAHRDHQVGVPSSAPTGHPAPVPQAMVAAAAATPGPPAPHADGTSETARLVAVEMAVAGYPRAQVGDRLQRQYGVSDPARILDEVFGRGTAGNSRMPWT